MPEKNQTEERPNADIVVSRMRDPAKSLLGTGAPAPATQVFDLDEMLPHEEADDLLHVPDGNLSAAEEMRSGLNEGKVQVTHAGKTVRMVKGQVQVRDAKTGRFVAMANKSDEDGVEEAATKQPGYGDPTDVQVRRMKEGDDDDDADDAEEQAAGGQEDQEAAAEEAGEEEQKAEGEEKKAEPKKTRRMRKHERYAAKDAEIAALRAENERLRAGQQAKDPTEIDYSKLPDPNGTETDEEYKGRVAAWMKEQDAARELARQAAREQHDREASAAADGQRQAHVNRTFTEELEHRFTPEQRAELGPKAAAVRGKNAEDPANPRPVTNYFLNERASLERAGHLPQTAKPAAEIFGDLYADAGSLQAFEDLTVQAPIMQGLAALDDPVAVALHLTSAQGKAQAEDLERIAVSQPQLVFTRLAQIAGALNGRPKGGREPAPGDDERVSQTPAPGHSPRAGRGAPPPEAKPQEPRPGMVDPAYLERHRKSVWATSGGR